MPCRYVQTDFGSTPLGSLTRVVCDDPLTNFRIFEPASLSSTSTLRIVPRQKIGAFLSSFHAKLERGARVVFGDNLDEGEDPDAEGNLYQRRRLPGTRSHRIIKNCPSQRELDEMLAPFTRSVEHQRFERDWFASYELTSQRDETRESGNSHEKSSIGAKRIRRSRRLYI